MGFEIKDPKEQIAWERVLCFRHGISPHEHRKCLRSDMQEIKMIFDAIHERSERTANINAAIVEMMK